MKVQKTLPTPLKKIEDITVDRETNIKTTISFKAYIELPFARGENKGTIEECH